MLDDEDDDVARSPDELPRRQQRTHYTEQRLRRDPEYRGIANEFTDEEAEALLIEMLRYFGMTTVHELPNPPRGLPGEGAFTFSYDTRAVLETGFSYFLALVQRQPRRQLNLWNRAEQLLKKQYEDGRKEPRRSPRLLGSHFKRGFSR